MRTVGTRGLVAVGSVMALMALACSRINPEFDGASGTGAGDIGTDAGLTSDDGAAGTSGADTSDDAGSTGGSGGATSSGTQSGTSGASGSGGARTCADGLGPIPGMLCHRAPTYIPLDGAWAVAAGDVDGDGDADIVIGGADAWVLRGDGAGSFSPPSASQGIPEPRDATIADLDGGGAIDFVIVGGQGGDETFGVYLGDGNGGHAAPDIYDAGEQLSGIVSADLDGDGARGLYASNIAGSNLVALVHQGSGSYGNPWTADVGNAPDDLDAGDLDGDGDPDLAVANLNDGTVSILMNNGAGGLTETGVYDTDPGPGTVEPNAMVMVDVSGDGRLDVVTANRLTDEVVVLLGDGAGGVADTSGYIVDTSPIDLARGDFDGDGRQEVASANREAGTVSVLLADGAGELIVMSPLDVNPQPRHLAAADFNEDGADDLVVTFPVSNEIAIMISDL